MASPEARHLARCRDLVWRQAYACVLVRPRRGSIVRLAATGPDLWNLLDEPQTLTELSRQLGSLYAADPEAIAADLRSVIDELVTAGVLEWS